MKGIQQADVKDLEEYDLIGIGSPEWASVPEHVAAFIRSMPGLSGKHCFVFFTHGASPERFLPKALELLTERKLTVIGMGDWYGGVNQPTLPKPYLTEGPQTRSILLMIGAMEPIRDRRNESS